jgi:hypothetical protein
VTKVIMSLLVEHDPPIFWIETPNKYIHIVYVQYIKKKQLDTLFGREYMFYYIYYFILLHYRSWGKEQTRSFINRYDATRSDSTTNHMIKIHRLLSMINKGFIDKHLQSHYLLLIISQNFPSICGFALLLFFTLVTHCLLLSLSAPTAFSSRCSSTALTTISISCSEVLNQHVAIQHVLYSFTVYTI